MLQNLAKRLRVAPQFITARLRRHWIGTTVIFLATVVFFWPLILNIGNYSEGGDAMFNAWTLARDQHCLLRQNCPEYANANIYFPHKDTMLYSETQLSAGLLTLPLHFIDQNPIFSYNVFTIVSFFLSGWFMYLLAKRLSKGNEFYSVLAGLAFEFAPLRISSISHLQNLSIFYLPLIVFLVLKYVEKPRRKYLIWLLIVLALQFYASWYQMVFVCIALAIFFLAMFLGRLMTWEKLWKLSLTTLLAIILTLPLALEYVHFSKTNGATFSVLDQAKYSSSLADYVKPRVGTIMGKIYYHVRPHAQPNSYNPDSYSYHGMILYVVAAGVLVAAYRQRRSGVQGRQRYRFVMVFVALGVAAFIFSLGPLLKLQASAYYQDGQVGSVVIPLPYILVDKLLPQLSFIRAIGRISVLLLFSLCAILALAPVYLSKEKLYRRYKHWILGIVSLLVVIELMPIHLNPMVSQDYFYKFTVPKVYQFIKDNKAVDNLAVIAADRDYPGATIPVARAEQILWSGYHNKNLFNGYSGYTPPTYFSDYDDFVDFHADDVAKMKALGLHYVVVDKQLSTSNPGLPDQVSAAAAGKIYEDSRYVLFKL